MYAFKMLLIELCLKENRDELRLIDISYSGNSLESREPTSSKTRNHGEILAEPMKVQQHLLDGETCALQQIMWYWTSSVRYELKMEGSSDRQKGPS
uniref:SNARE-complex protein syntaxin-18 N-terminal n=1 Tax=Tanacetum cinerariifolium TaxID=118510 RepID=A0A6L2L7S9_TANCI|nr:SNARE-complex protein syntaxin-18 N-terminal [Tanacetum cinerariifolium]